jgi:ribonuclease HI
MKTCIAYIDGGSRGNPGIAGYGVDIRNEKGQPIASLSQNLGIRTNNFAEYSALLGALRYAKSQGYEGVKIFADSELLVNQLLGIYKVKSVDLKPLYEEAKDLLRGFKSFSIRHVPREQNQEADRLANLAMDAASEDRSPDEISSSVRRVMAVFREGCFHPLGPIELPENARFHLTVRPVHTER